MLTIGLEIHIYPRTESKMFCSCSAEFLDAAPNTNICPICTGQPGSKPIPPNSACISAGLKIARALSMKPAAGPVATLRKHYFYPDLPSNYQRTSEPLATGGDVRGVPLREIHWEEDPGQYDTGKGLVDFNRSGVPLLELVTEPSLRSAEGARQLLNDTLLVLRYLGVARGEMPFKVDTNVSTDGGHRVEVKNINSISGVSKALEYEEARQSELLSRGTPVRQETRRFDELSLKTTAMRYKETSEDYRYMRDPDILPVNPGTLDDAVAEQPFAIIDRMVRGGAKEDDARTIIADSHLLRAYNLISGSTSVRYASIFVARDLKGELNYRMLDTSYLDGKAVIPSLLRIGVAYDGGRLSNQNAAILLRMVFDGTDITQRLEEYTAGFADESSIEEAAGRVIALHPDAVEHYRSGGREVINYFVGLCMKELGGKARPGDVISVLERKLLQH